MQRLWITIILMLSGLALAAAGQSAPSCKQLREQIRKEGARPVLDMLWRDDQRLFLPLLERISTGDRCWLRFAAEIKPASDAGSSEELEAAMSRALTLQPRRVLSYLSEDEPFPLESICEGTQVSVDETSKGYAVWIKAARRALRKGAPFATNIESKRQRCLAVVERDYRRSRTVPLDFKFELQH